jgi:MFS family permease
MQRPLFAAILFSTVLVAIIPLASTMIHLLVIITLIGVTSGFFGQSIVWAAEQIEEKVKRGKESVGSNRALEVHSHVMRGIGFNRMIGDLGLIMGPLFVGYLVAALSNNPLSWPTTFGLTSAVLGIVAFLILRFGVRCKT